MRCSRVTNCCADKIYAFLEKLSFSCYKSLQAVYMLIHDNYYLIIFYVDYLIYLRRRFIVQLDGDNIYDRVATYQFHEAKGNERETYKRRRKRCVLSH